MNYERVVFRPSRWSWAVVLSAVLVCACARVIVTHVPAGDVSNGVHFYEPRAYLLVGMEHKTDEKKTDENKAGEKTKVPDHYTSQIIWLPDPSRRFNVEVKPGLGTVDGNMKLSNGWMLSEFGAKSDSKIPETVTSVSGLVKEAAGFAAAEVTSEVGLYRIDIAPDGSVKLVKQHGWR